MAKSKLQERAEGLAREFKESMLPTIVIEFAGVPKVGKTSTLNEVYSFLRRCGFQCDVVIERASVCPIRDKKHFNFNIWTACTSLAYLLEKTQDPPRDGDPDILFLDRGIFDSICWLSLLQKLNRIRDRDRINTANFLLTNDWAGRITGVIAMSASPDDALKREPGRSQL
jgi:predicted ATPase